MVLNIALISNSRTAWPAEILVQFFKFPKQFASGWSYYFFQTVLTILSKLKKHLQFWLCMQFPPKIQKQAYMRVMYCSPFHHCHEDNFTVCQGFIILFTQSSYSVALSCACHTYLILKSCVCLCVCLFVYVFVIVNLYFCE